MFFFVALCHGQELCLACYRRTSAVLESRRLPPAPHEGAFEILVHRKRVLAATLMQRTWLRFQGRVSFKRKVSPPRFEWLCDNFGLIYRGTDLFLFLVILCLLSDNAASLPTQLLRPTVASPCNPSPPNIYGLALQETPSHSTSAT